jgi:hypothetical protein
MYVLQASGLLFNGHREPRKMVWLTTLAQLAQRRKMDWWTLCGRAPRMMASSPMLAASPRTEDRRALSHWFRKSIALREKITQG